MEHENCSICGKKAAFARCQRCGMLMHYSCMATSKQDLEQGCPHCMKSLAVEEDENPQRSILLSRFAKGVITAPRGPDAAEDLRPPCPAGELPTDEEARKEGFKDAKEWMAMSNGGLLTHPALYQSALDEVRKPAEGGTEENNPLEWWRYLQGSPLPTNSEDVDAEPGPMHDIAAVVSSEMNIQNPYLLTDVEVYHREYARTTRDDLSEACREAWSQEAVAPWK